MIQELNLTAEGTVIMLLFLAWIIYRVIKAPPAIVTFEIDDEAEIVSPKPPEYLSRYGAVIQMQGR